MGGNALGGHLAWCVHAAVHLGGAVCLVRASFVQHGKYHKEDKLLQLIL